MVPRDRSFGGDDLQGALLLHLFAAFVSLVFQDEVFALCFRFDPTYPIQAPAVTFVVDDKYTAPVHPVRMPLLGIHIVSHAYCSYAARLLERPRKLPNAADDWKADGFILPDLRFDSGERMVARADRQRSLPHPTKYAGVMQGTSSIPQHAR